MRYAILSDIHANLDALTSVLDAIRDVGQIDHIVCLGDVVGYGPEPTECLRRVRESECTLVAGNHDYAACQKIDITTFNLNAREATLWTRQHLDEDDLHFLSELPLVEELDGFTAVHGSLHTPELFDYVQTCYDAALSMQRMTQPLCVIGHSHVPVGFVRRDVVSYSVGSKLPVDADARTIVNVGSVGQPRDNDPRACFALYDSDESAIELCRVPYDIENVAAKIDAAGLPKVLGDRLRIGR